MEQDKEHYQRALNEAIRQYPVGSLIEGTVVRHMQFGVFVDIGHNPVIGLVSVVNFRDDFAMSPEQFPAVGSTIKGIVLGIGSGEIYIGMKPSHLALVGL